MQSIFWRINEMFDERTCDFQLEMDKEKFETSKINIIKILYILNNEFIWESLHVL